MKRDLVKDAGSNSHNVAKCNQRNISQAAESSYCPLDSSINPQVRTFCPIKQSQFRGERQALPIPTNICSACDQQGYWRKFCPAVKWNFRLNSRQQQSNGVKYNENMLNSVMLNQPMGVS